MSRRPLTSITRVTRAAVTGPPAPEHGSSDCPLAPPRNGPGSHRASRAGIDEAHGDEAHGDEAHGEEAHGEEAHGERLLGTMNRQAGPTPLMHPQPHPVCSLDRLPGLLGDAS